MSILHAGFTFDGRAGTILPGPLRLPKQRISFPGIDGVSILIGVPKERILQCEYTIDGESSVADLNTTIAAINAHQGNSGTLAVSGTAAVTYQNCLFEQFIPREAPKNSVGGETGWLIRGVLVWTQYLIP